MIVFTMEHSKDFYETVIRVIDSLGNEKWSIHNEKARLAAGNYWTEIVRLIRSYTDNDSYRSCGISHPPCLRVVREDCERMIRNIENAEHDRKLNNAGIIVAICCGIIGIIISCVSLIWTIHTDTRLNELEKRVTVLEQTVFPRHLNHDILPQ